VIAGKVAVSLAVLLTLVMTSYLLKSLIDLDMLYKPKETEPAIMIDQTAITTTLSVLTILAMPCTEIVDKNFKADSLIFLAFSLLALSLLA
jgi:hypothetical protein